jgi:single-strand DNA-binding protein
MLNKFLGIGNLTRDPELKEFDNSKCVCVFSVAINLGKNEKTPLYVDVQVWDNIARNCKKYLKKGRKVFVEGRIATNSWTSKSGEKRTKMFCKGDIVTFLNSEKTEEPTSTIEKNTETSQDFTTEDEELSSIPF